MAQAFEAHRELASQPLGRGTFCSSSTSSSSVSSRRADGGPPVVESYTESTVQSVGRDGRKVREVQQSYSNTASGLQKASIERGLDARARKIVKERYKGSERSTDMFQNLNENQASQFDREWDEHSAALPPHLRTNMGHNLLRSDDESRPHHHRASPPWDGNRTIYPHARALQQQSRRHQPRGQSQALQLTGGGGGEPWNSAATRSQRRSDSNDPQGFDDRPRSGFRTGGTPPKKPTLRGRFDAAGTLSSARNSTSSLYGGGAGSSEADYSSRRGSRDSATSGASGGHRDVRQASSSSFAAAPQSRRQRTTRRRGSTSSSSGYHGHHGGDEEADEALAQRLARDEARRLG